MWTFLTALCARVVAFVRPENLDRDFDQEMASHLSMLEEEHMQRGLTPAQAHRAARLKLGGLTQLREAHRDVRGLPILDTCLLDVRYALRAMQKHPAFTALAVATLAIGIGVNTAVFTAVDSAFLRPLHVPDPTRVVQL